MINIKVRKLTSDAKLPIIRANNTMIADLFVTRISSEINEAGELILVYHTGIVIEIPNGYSGLLFPEDDISRKTLEMCNSVGVIPNCSKQEVVVKFRPTSNVVPALYNPGERFAQLLILPVPDVQFEEAETLSETDRGEGGYGSTNETETSAPQATQSLPETEVETTNSEPSNEGSGEAQNSLEEA